MHNQASIETNQRLVQAAKNKAKPCPDKAIENTAVLVYGLRFGK